MARFMVAGDMCVSLATSGTVSGRSRLPSSAAAVAFRNPSSLRCCSSVMRAQ